MRFVRDEDPKPARRFSIIVFLSEVAVGGGPDILHTTDDVARAAKVFLQQKIPSRSECVLAGFVSGPCVFVNAWEDPTVDCFGTCITPCAIYGGFAPSQITDDEVALALNEMAEALANAVGQSFAKIHFCDTVWSIHGRP